MPSYALYNWNKSAVSRPANVVRPESQAALIKLVQGTLEQKGGPKLRAAGHRHSMSACFETSGIQIDTTRW